MEKQPFPHDATPDVHAFSSPPENVKDLINRYGTYNIQPTSDTENLFPLIAPGLPEQWKRMAIGKNEVEKFNGAEPPLR